MFPRIMPILHGLIHLARSGSVFVTMAVTLERYFAIVYPFKDFKLKKGLLPIAIFFAILYNIPKVRKTISFYIGFMGSKLHFTYRKILPLGHDHSHGKTQYIPQRCNLPVCFPLDLLLQGMC